MSICNQLSLTNKKEDERLTNWKKWIKIRQEMFKFFSNKQNRRPIDLSLNAADFYRQIQEEKIVFDCIKIPTFHSTRGSPAFWNLPPSSYRHPSLQAVRTYSQRREIPQILYYGIPTEIQKEKGTFSETPKEFTWFKNPYRQLTMIKYYREMNQVEPHWPDTDLMIIGNEFLFHKKKQDSIKKQKVEQKQKMENLTKRHKHKKHAAKHNHATAIVFESTADANESISSKYVNKEQSQDMTLESELIAIETLNEMDDNYSNETSSNLKIALKIQNAVFDNQSKQSVYNQKIAINYEIGKDIVISKQITIENIGDVSIKFFWEKQTKDRILKKLLPYRLPSCKFIFKKNISIILPEEKTVLTIHFKTDKPCFGKEIWIMRTIPNIFTSGKFVMHLCYCASLAYIKEREQAIIDRINEGIKQGIVEGVYVSLVADVSHKQKASPELAITEGDIFEAINLEFGPSNTESIPKIYHYDSSLVEELKLFYKDLKADLNLVDDWNYSIQELFNYIDQYEDKIQQNLKLNTLQSIVDKFVVTEKIENTDQYKFNVVYNIIATMFQEMSKRVYQIREFFQVPFKETYPPVKKQLLLRQFSLSKYRLQNYLSNKVAFDAIKKVKTCENVQLRPSIEFIRSIPLEEVDRRWKLYRRAQNEDTDSSTSVKKKPVKKKKKGKDKKNPAEKPTIKIKSNKKDKLGKKTGKTGKKKKSKDASKRTSKVKIEPVSKEPITRVISLTNLQKGPVSIHPSYICDKHVPMDECSHYYLNLYVTIYSLLCEAIDQIDNVLTDLKESRIMSNLMLKRCIEYGVPTLEPEPPNKPPQRISSSVYKKILEEAEANVYEKLSVPIILESIQQNEIKYVASCGTSELNFIPSSSTTSQSSTFFKVEYADAQTETCLGEVDYVPKTRPGHIQTDFDDDEFDLVALIEREMTSTSLQYIRKPTADKSTQFDQCEVCAVTTVFPNLSNSSFSNL